MFLLLYPDDPSHMKALDIIRDPANNYQYAAIAHDGDMWTEEDEKENPAHKAGEFKKIHFHVILRFTSAVWNTSICKDLGIELNYCLETEFKIDDLLLYLLHYNNNDKTPYDVTQVEGPLKVRLEELLKKHEKTEGETGLDIITYIEDSKGHISYINLVKWAAANGYWAELRRGGTLFIKCVEENNYGHLNMPHKHNKKEF